MKAKAVVVAVLIHLLLLSPAVLTGNEATQTGQADPEMVFCGKISKPENAVEPKSEAQPEPKKSEPAKAAENKVSDKAATSQKEEVRFETHKLPAGWGLSNMGAKFGYDWRIIARDNSITPDQYRKLAVGMELKIRITGKAAAAKPEKPVKKAPVAQKPAAKAHKVVKPKPRGKKTYRRARVRINSKGFMSNARRYTPGQPTLLNHLGDCPYNPDIWRGNHAKNRGFRPLVRDGAMTLDEAREFDQALRNGDFKIVYIKGILKNGQWLPQFSLMAFGQGRVHYLLDVAPTNEDLWVGFQKKLSSGRTWVQFRDCGNPALRIWVPKPKPKPIPKAPKKPELPFLAPPQKLPEPAPKCRVRERVNSLFGGGVYASTDDDHEGAYIWTQQKVFLICTKPLPNVQMDVGAMYFGGAGWGRDGKYRYRWWEHDGGLALKFYGKKWDSDLCFTVGRLLNAGHEGKYVSKQTETVFRPWFHLNYRPGWETKWFPEFEFNAQARFAISRPRHRHSYAGEMLKPKRTNNDLVDATFTAWIRDFQLNPVMSLRPGIYTTVGHEWSSLNTFFQIGPMLRARINGQEAATIGFGYKHGTVGDQVQVFASVRPDGIWRGIRAGRIKKIDTKNSLKEAGINPDNYIHPKDMKGSFRDAPKGGDEVETLFNPPKQGDPPSGKAVRNPADLL